MMDVVAGQRRGAAVKVTVVAVVEVAQLLPQLRPQTKGMDAPAW
jgi:hypothetical protein